MSQPNESHSFLARLPGVALFRGYVLADLPADLLAGLVVTLVLIPSAIAYSDLAKCPPAAGLYAALGGMVAFALFTSTKHVINGPDAAIALMVGAAVASLGDGDPAKSLAISTWLALLTGALLLLAAWLKLGAAADFLANPVMLGFMNGAALVIVISQLGKLFGLSLHEENSLLKVKEWATQLPKTHWLTLGMGLGFIGILVAMRVWLRRVPGAIVVFAVALAAGRLIDFPSLGMAVIGTVDTSIPDPMPPGLSLNEAGRLAIAAVGIAFLVFPEGIVLGRSVANKRGYRINPDRELVALGAANIVAGLLRSYSVGASQSRTLLNDTTGGRTQLVSLIAGTLLILFMALMAEWIAALPTVAMAAILTFTGVTLIDADAVRKLRNMRRADASIAILTSMGVVALGVLPGVLLGVFLSLTRLLKQLARPHDALLARAEGSSSFHDVGDDERAKTIPGVVVYRFYAPLIFANVRYFIERVEHFIDREKTPVRQVVLDARAIPEIDVTAADELRSYLEKLRRRGIAFTTAKAHLPLRQAAASFGLQEWFAENNSLDQAAERCLAESSAAPHGEADGGTPSQAAQR